MRFGWFYKTKRFTGFTNLVNFDAVLSILVFFCAILRFSDPPLHPTEMVLCLWANETRKYGIKEVELVK